MSNQTAPDAAAIVAYLEQQCASVEAQYRIHTRYAVQQRDPRSDDHARAESLFIQLQTLRQALSFARDGER